MRCDHRSDEDVRALFERVRAESRDLSELEKRISEIQLSRDRFMLCYATRGWRGTDEDRSIIYQIRKDGFDGPVIREAGVCFTTDTWRPDDGGGSGRE